MKIDGRIVLGGLRAGAIMSTGMVYGTDAFFSIVGASALARSSDRSLTEVMGLLHETADRRMPIVGGAGLIASLAYGVLAETTADRIFGSSAAVLQIVYVVLYARYSKPVNELLIAAAERASRRPTHTAYNGAGIVSFTSASC